MIAFVVALIATGWCWWAVGAGLGLFFGAILLAALYVPSLSVMERAHNSWINLCALTLGVCACWAMAMPWQDVTIFELLRCCLVCAAFVWAMGGLAVALGKLKLSPPFSAALISAVALLWLTWPAWMSHALTQHLVNALVIAHPLLAINGVLQHLGTWDRAPIAYRQLTILNQDIPYHLPQSIFPAVAVHGVIGLIGSLLARAKRYT